LLALYCPEQFEIASVAVRFQRQKRRAMPSVEALWVEAAEVPRVQAAEALWVEVAEVPRVQAAKVPRVETLGVLAKGMRAMLALALMLAPAPMALELMQVLTLAPALAVPEVQAMGTLLLALTLLL
jgi:hypothetical protein